MKETRSAAVVSSSGMAVAVTFRTGFRAAKRRPAVFRTDGERDRGDVQLPTSGRACALSAAISKTPALARWIIRKLIMAGNKLIATRSSCLSHPSTAPSGVYDMVRHPAPHPTCSIEMERSLVCKFASTYAATRKGGWYGAVAQ